MNPNFLTSFAHTFAGPPLRVGAVLLTGWALALSLGTWVDPGRPTLAEVFAPLVGMLPLVAAAIWIKRRYGVR